MIRYSSDCYLHFNFLKCLIYSQIIYTGLSGKYMQAFSTFAFHGQYFV